MRDFLEELLARQADALAREGAAADFPAWTAPAPGPPGGAPAPGPRQSAPAGPGEPSPAHAPAADAAPGGTVPAASALPAALARTAALSAALARPPGTAAGAGVPLYARLRRTAESAGYRRQAVPAAWEVPPAPAAAGLTLEELDLAVERDARRADGGFALY